VDSSTDAPMLKLNANDAAPNPIAQARNLHRRRNEVTRHI
jgi:hypothetical protein